MKWIKTRDTQIAEIQNFFLVKQLSNVMPPVKQITANVLRNRGVKLVKKANKGFYFSYDMWIEQRGVRVGKIISTEVQEGGRYKIKCSQSQPKPVM